MNDHALLAQMTATHCCVCRAPLTDSESVEHGIGPVCSRKYYAPSHLPNEYQVQVALGMLTVSGLPDRIIDGFLACVDNAEGHEKVDARRACNILVYWASCHYDDQNEVFRCSAVIRALGYDDLADKLEIDRTVARIEDLGTHLYVLVGNKIGFERDLLQIPGAKRTGGKVGSKYGWEIPIAESDHFHAVLGLHYGGGLACGGKQRVWTIPYKKYNDVLAFRQKVPAQNPNGITVTVVGSKVRVRTPYNEGFKNDLKAKVPGRSRRWTGDCWELDMWCLTLAREMVKQHFGATV